MLSMLRCTTRVCFFGPRRRFSITKLEIGRWTLSVALHRLTPMMMMTMMMVTSVATPTLITMKNA